MSPSTLVPVSPVVEAIQRPSWLKLTLKTGALCPRKVSVSWPVLASQILSVGLEGEQILAGNRIPDPDESVLAARGDPPAIGAESSAEHGLRVMQGLKAFQSQPFEVVPFPAAQVGGAGVEQSLHPAKII